MPPYASLFRRLFIAESPERPGHLGARWLFLRALGLIYFSAFYSLVFQIRGLIGPPGIFPVGSYLQEVTRQMGAARFWYAPTVLWLASGNHAVVALCWVGMIASLLLVANVWPRGMLFVCFVAYLSFVAAAQEFANYQSDGMLLEAGFIAWFFAPPGLRPGAGRAHPPALAPLYLLRWEWFRIYFESGVAKMAGGDPQWRNFTAMDEYYQNGPLPTWIGWYIQRLPHGFHAATALLTLVLELGLVFALFLPRRFRIILFWIVTPWEIGIILTANYTFLNYLVLLLGILLLDDKYLAWLAPKRWKMTERLRAEPHLAPAFAPEDLIRLDLKSPAPSAAPSPGPAAESKVTFSSRWTSWRRRLRPASDALRLSVSAILLGWVFYGTTALLLGMLTRGFSPLPTGPVAILEPFRIANSFGLFGIMTRGRYEIEFQGSDDGQTWRAYPFRYKPQDPSKPPGIYAPYQPRFDWNLWFASLETWRGDPLTLRTEVRLLENDADVLSLFAGDPFGGKAPSFVRAVIWQYWFTDLQTKRTQGLWWRRELLGLYAPELQRLPDRRIAVVELPQPAIPPPQQP